jgi:enterobacterial common antigen flippase
MFRASALTVVVSLSMGVVSLVNTSVTARALGVEGRGLLASALLVVSLARGLALLGLGEAFVYQGRNGRLTADGRRYLLAALAMVVAVGALIASAFIPFGPLKTALVVAGVTIAQAAVGTGFDLLVAASRFEPELRIFNWLRALGPSLATFSLILFWVFAPLSVETILALQTAATLCAGLVGYAAIKRMLAAQPAKVAAVRQLTVPQFLRSGIGYQGIAVMVLIVTHAHMYFVMSVGTLAAFGIYSAAFGLSRVISPIQMSIGSAVFAASAGGGDVSSGLSAAKAFRVTFFPLLLAAGLLSALAPFITRLLLGQEFQSAAVPFAILTFEAVVSGAAYILVQRLAALGRVATVLAINGISMIPILLGFVILNASNVMLGMSWLMLSAAILKLIATLLSYRSQVGLKGLVIPSRQDFRALRALATRAR